MSDVKWSDAVKQPGMEYKTIWYSESNSESLDKELTELAKEFWHPIHFWTRYDFGSGRGFEVTLMRTFYPK